MRIDPDGVNRSSSVGPAEAVKLKRAATGSGIRREKSNPPPLVSIVRRTGPPVKFRAKPSGLTPNAYALWGIGVAPGQYVSGWHLDVH